MLAKSEDLGVLGDIDETKVSFFENSIVPVIFAVLLAEVIDSLVNDEMEVEDKDEAASVLLDADLILVSLPRFLLPSNDPLIAKNSPNFCPMFPPPIPIPPPPHLLWGLPLLIFLLLDKGPPPLLLALPRLLELLMLSPLPCPLLLLPLLSCRAEFPLCKVAVLMLVWWLLLFLERSGAAPAE